MDESISYEQISELKYELQQKSEIIESQKQELYSIQKKLECMDIMKVEMEIEIEALNGLYQINGSLETKVKTQENEILKLQKEAKELENQLSDEKDRNKNECCELRNKVLSLEQELNAKNENILNETEEQLKLRNNDLQEQFNILKENVEELKVQKGEYEYKIAILETELNEKTQEIQEFKDIMDVKNDNLKSSENLVQELQEEKCAMQAELIALKATGINYNERGNSIFAEVEDKRVSIASQLEILQKKYKELKTAFVKKNTEIKLLQAENNNLRKQWKEDNDAPYEAASQLMESYKIRISELSSLVAELEKRPESPQIISINDLNNAQMNCIKSLLEYERKTNRELKNEMQQRAARENFTAEQKYELEKKMKVMKAQAMKNCSIMSELRSELEYYKNLNQGSQKDDSSLKDISNKKESVHYSVPIEAGTGKSVRFDETIMETSMVSATKMDDSVAFKKPLSVYNKMQDVVSVKVGKENNR